MTVNWDDISKDTTLSETFMLENKHNMNWKIASVHQNFTEDFMEQLFEERLIHWDALSRNPCLSERFIEKHKFEVNWSYIMYRQNLSLPFLQTYEDKIDFLYLSHNPFILANEEILRFYKDKVDWSTIFVNIQFRESFIEDIVSSTPLYVWSIISKYQVLSKAFIHKYIKNIWIDYLEENKHLSFTEEELQELKSLQRVASLSK